jgi:hypothetical protein
MSSAPDCRDRGGYRGWPNKEDRTDHDVCVSRVVRLVDVAPSMGRSGAGLGHGRCADRRYSRTKASDLTKLKEMAKSVSV